MHILETKIDKKTATRYNHSRVFCKWILPWNTTDVSRDDIKEMVSLQIRALGASVHGVKADDEGMMADDLDRVLTSWDELHPGIKKPKVIYFVTSGGNPTGVTWSEGRKHAVYDVARTHDMILLEDDAYYFLTFTRVSSL
jgi:aspartate/methionine/tyrosine aminotransferase